MSSYHKPMKIDKFHVILKSILLQRGILSRINYNVLPKGRGRGLISIYGKEGSPNYHHDHCLPDIFIASVTRGDAYIELIKRIQDFPVLIPDLHIQEFRIVLHDLMSRFGSDSIEWADFKNQGPFDNRFFSHINPSDIMKIVYFPSDDFDTHGTTNKGGAYGRGHSPYTSIMNLKKATDSDIFISNFSILSLGYSE
jgi:hypothetical protein